MTYNLSTNTFLVYSNNNLKHMENIIKSYIRHESKVLFETKTRIFTPTSASQTFNEQFLRFNSSDIARRGDFVEQFTRNSNTVIDISPKRFTAIDILWEIERSCPNIRLESASMTEYQRIILAQIESLETTVSPFKQILEDYNDILATGWGSI